MNAEPKTGLLYSVAFLVLVAISTSPSFADDQLAISGVNLYGLSGAPEGLSGITWAGGNQYYAVEDTGGLLHPITITINSSTGAVTGASFGTELILNGRTDLEAVAYSGAGTVYVSDETGATITEYSISGGNALSSVAVPDVFTAYRTNKSLESLTRQAGGQSLWTANEEALYGTSTLGVTIDDGGISTSSYGTIVRLQKFNSSLNPSGQWAYKVDQHKGDPFSGTPASGVSDLCVLPDGKLLVLEREVGGFIPSFRNRIYQVDFTGATDVSGDHTLHDFPESEMVTKTLLWEGNFGLNNNFEGLCLGEQLDNDNDYSLLMISDGDGTPNESLYALRLSGDISILSGDVDGDGFVDGSDLNTIVSNWGLTGATRAQGDLTGEGKVGGLDYNQVLSNWGAGTPPTETIPEPATLGLLLVGGAVLLRKRLH